MNTQQMLDNLMNPKTARQTLIADAVCKIHPALVSNEEYVWRQIDKSAVSFRQTAGSASYDYYMALDLDGLAATRLLKTVQRAVYVYNGS